ncbi:hypothetical protein C7E25_24940, partial [Stenotrophomonas maltophilia]
TWVVTAAHSAVPSAPKRTSLPSISNGVARWRYALRSTSDLGGHRRPQRSAVGTEAHLFAFHQQRRGALAL